MLYATGGTILAVREALCCHIAVNLGGGYHHASRDRGEGFCVYADVAIALARLRAEARLRTALIIDLDAHQGNGLERTYGGDPDTNILDMYTSEIYPRDFEARDSIDWDVPLRSGTGDKEYLDLLGEALPRAPMNSGLTWRSTMPERISTRATPWAVWRFLKRARSSRRPLRIRLAHRAINSLGHGN